MLYMLSSQNEDEQAQKAWNLMSLEGQKQTIHEKSLLMFICSVLSYEKEFINQIASVKKKPTIN